MSDVTQIVNDQRNVNETPKSFDSVESVHSRGRPPVNSNERQFVSQDPINPAARFRPGDLNQFQLWRQPPPPPTGRPPLAYPPPNRFAARNANEPRPFPPRNPIPPLRTQEFQNRRSFEKPERSYDIDLSPVENRVRPNSPWQRVRERLPLQSTNHQSDMESTQMKINAFEDAMNREMNKDRIPPFRRDSIVNADSRLKPQPDKRFSDEEESFRKNRPGDLPINQSNDLRKQSIVSGEFARREGGPDPRIFDPNSQHRPSLTQLQMNETNYINDRGQQNANVPPKTRPLQAVPEHENRNYINRNEDERLREDQNRNYRQDSYSRDYRKLGDFENINKENRKFSNRSEDELSDETRVMTRKFSQRSFDNGRENYNNRFDGDMNYESVRGKNEVPFNRIDVNGVNDKNALTRVNDHKTVLDKKPTANGDIKPPSSLPELKKEKSALKTPTKKISPKSPEIGSANSLGDKKKVPMNKVQVGSAPSPNLKVVRSKIGSLENYTHKPGGGKVKIENRKLEWKVQPRIEAKNDKYAPSGGDKKITQVKLQWSAKSKIGSLENATHKPGGGAKKIESVKLDFKDKAKPKVGSKDNIKHVPGGGTVKKTTDVDAKSTTSNIEDQKLDIKAQSKVGSLDNVKHQPGGGDKKIFDDKEYLKQTALTNESSKANSVTTSGSQAPEDPQICSRDSQQKENQTATVDAITCKKPDKPGKDQVKPKNEPKSPKNEKNKSHPSTPKQSFSAESKPSSTHPEKATSAKSNTKVQEEKIDQKPKPESMPEVKPELKKIPSKDKIKTDNFKSKVPTAQPRELVKISSKEKFKEELNLKNSMSKQIPITQVKQNLDSVSKTDGKKLPDVSVSRSENLSENKSKSSKDEIRNENNNKIETTAADKKSSEMQVPKSQPENKSIPATKPPVEVIISKKQNSKSKIEPKLNVSDTSKREEKKELNIDNVENKSNISNNSLKDSVKPNDPIESNKSSIVESANVEDPKKDSNDPNLKSSIEIETNKSKDQSKLLTNVPKENSTDKNSNLKDEIILSKQIETPNNFNLDQSKSNTNTPKEKSDSNNENKSTKINEQIKAPNNLNADQPKLPTNAPKENIDSSNENKLTKINEQIKTSNQSNTKSDDEKSKLPKIENNQKDNMIQDIKPNPIKSPPPEINKTTETFSLISKTAVETKSADSTSRTTAESKISDIPVNNEKQPLLHQTENQNKILATNEKTEPTEKKNSEPSSTPSVTSQNQQVPSIPPSTSGSK